MPIPKVRVKGGIAGQVKETAMDVAYAAAKGGMKLREMAAEGIAGVARDGALANAMADVKRRTNDVENPASGDPYKKRK